MSDLPDSTVLLVKELARRFPALELLLQEHLVDNFNEVLPHVFFGDLTRYIVERYSAHDGAVMSILDELERMFTTDDAEVHNLIAVSFLENLPDPGELGADLRRFLGPALRWELSRMSD